MTVYEPDPWLHHPDIAPQKQSVLLRWVDDDGTEREREIEIES